MSIEQTNQLILLILNSVLMTLLSAVLLGGAWLRQSSLAQQLQQVRLRYRQITQAPGRVGETPDTDLSVPAQAADSEPRKASLKADLKRVRDRRQQLSNQYLWSRTGMLTLHVVLLVFGVSLFALALRSLLLFDALIAAALFLFTVGTAGLLAGIGFVLMDLVQGNSGGDSVGRSLGKAMTQLAHWWQRQLAGPTPSADSRQANFKRPLKPNLPELAIRSSSGRLFETDSVTD